MATESKQTIFEIGDTELHTKTVYFSYPLIQCNGNHGR